MNRREYISNRKMRFIFEVSPFQLLEAKVGDADFDLEDHRFCFGCDRWYNAAYWIAIIERDNQADFVCSGCAEQFDEMAASDKASFLDACYRSFSYWEDELKCALEDRAA